VQLRNSLKSEVVERVKEILDSKGLTLYQISEQTRSLYGPSSPYFLPHNLYYNIGLGTFSPSLHQLFALSKISDYRFNDWLCVFGFNPEDIVRLQVFLASKRTLLLDTSVDDPESWVPWFRDRPENRSIPAIAPIAQLLDLAPSRRLRSVQETGTNDFIYAKIGLEDALAFPDLLPGSIVRANARLTKLMLPVASGEATDCLFLIEHANGFWCCRLQAVGKRRLVPLSTQLPYAQVEMELPSEARVIGVLDLEIRSLLRSEQPEVPKELAKHRRPLTLAPAEKKLSQLLRNARFSMGLSFREASAMSRRMATELGDERYFAAPGSLSDYEALDTPPRHVHKVITLCAIYGLHFSTILKSIGLQMEEAGKHPIPDDLVRRKVPTGPRITENGELTGNGFLKQLLRRLEQVPILLRGSLTDLSGLGSLSLNDFFWVGGDQNPLHPLLVNGLIVVVNRHKKKALHFRSRSLREQPMYMLLKRDGTYICGCCSLENGTLVIHPYSLSHQRPEHLRNHNDAEVVGQIVTVVRRL
jgi:transcriptional regulator with XRE-family HTH domain